MAGLKGCRVDRGVRAFELDAAVEKYNIASFEDASTEAGGPGACRDADLLHFEAGRPLVDRPFVWAHTFAALRLLTRVSSRAATLAPMLPSESQAVAGTSSNPPELLNGGRSTPHPPLLDGFLSLVVPAHNEAENMPRVMSQARTVLGELASSSEVILVDDGSSDGTAEVARAALAGDAVGRLRVVTHERKSGYGVSVADGLRAAVGDYIAFVDGDGQFDLNDLTRLAGRIQTADLVAGIRASRADPWFRMIISGTFNVLVRLLYGLRYRDVDCGLKLMRRSVLDAATPIRARSALLNTELFFQARRSGLRIEQVEVPHYPRTAGVRSGARLGPILRAVRELVVLRVRLARRNPVILPGRSAN